MIQSANRLKHLPSNCSESSDLRDSSGQPHALTRLEALLADQQRAQIVSDGEGRIQSVRDVDGGHTSYRYDSHGNLIAIVEPNGEQQQFDYDPQGRLVKVVHSDSSITRYSYSAGAQSRLETIQDRHRCYRFSHDDRGRLTQACRGNAGTLIYRYDTAGRVITARTDRASTGYTYDDAGHLTQLDQTLHGITLTAKFTYNAAGQLVQLTLPGNDCPLEYEWTTEQGWPKAAVWGSQTLATFDYAPEDKITQIQFANGITETSQADPVDNRPQARSVVQGETILWKRDYSYTPSGHIQSDGTREYTYDALNRLIQAGDLASSQLSKITSATSNSWQYRYDALDNRLQHTDTKGTWTYSPGCQRQLQSLTTPDGSVHTFHYDKWGRLRHRQTPEGQWTYRYNDADQLIEVLHQGNCLARFTYDHKGLLVFSQTPTGERRYFYGADDALLVITDSQGNPLQQFVRTPLGLLAELRPDAGLFRPFFCHHDDQGTRHLLSDERGEIVEHFAYDPYGQPLLAVAGNLQNSPHLYTGQPYFPELSLYYFRCRWYDPSLGRFLTPDSYTGAPDDERLVNPVSPANRQALARAEILATWLKDYRDRNRYTYCRNDPTNHVDPTGHWSFGGVMLSILGAIWTLPNTLIGLVLEITCLIGEVIRWLVWLVSAGNVTWQSLGFDAAASGNLNAFALVFEGGWLGSMPSQLLGITFGNVFFVYKKWRDKSFYQGDELVYPPAFEGRIGVPKNRILYEHELRHTNQYGWFGPFFLVGLPIWGVYIWDAMLNGYYDAWLERDARAHSEGPTVPSVPAELTSEASVPDTPAPVEPTPEEENPTSPETPSPEDDPPPEEDPSPEADNPEPPP